MDAERQNKLIVEQFTAQAESFAKFPAHSQKGAMELVRQLIGLGPDDEALDVACGPGLVACDFAEHAARVTGIDLTPAMIDQARKLQAEKGLTNVDWRIGDVSNLPFADASFSIVFSRFSFHHLLDPARTLAEMARVCRPGGRVGVVDVYSKSPEQGAVYDHVEKLRDPSHVRALRLEEFAVMFKKAGLEEVTSYFHGLNVKLDELLASSSPNEDDAKEVRRIFREDVGVNRLGVNARLVDDAIQFTFPIAFFVGQKPG